MTSGLGSNMGSNLGSTMGSNMGPNKGSNMTSNMGPNMSSNLGLSVGPGMTTNVSPNARLSQGMVQGTPMTPTTPVRGPIAAGIHNRSYSYSYYAPAAPIRLAAESSAMNRPRAYSQGGFEWQRHLSTPFSSPSTASHPTAFPAPLSSPVSPGARPPPFGLPLMPEAPPVPPVAVAERPQPRRLSSSMRTSRSRRASTSTITSVGSDSESPDELLDLSSATHTQIYALCRDQRGCRYLQHRLGERDPVICARIFEATVPHIVGLMMDPFGNYFCQKLVEHSPEHQVTALIRECAPHMVEIGLNPHGTRALQKTIEAVTTHEQVDLIVTALDGSVVRLIRDLNGNHVVQKLLLEFDEYGTQFVYDAVCDSVVEVGSHRHGCCVLQRCLDYSKPLNRHRLVSHIVAQAGLLVTDPFGNYVCQYVVDLGVPEYTTALVQQLLGSVAQLSMQKFASNVVEKCLRMAEPPLQRELVMELVPSATLQVLLLDSYGNYVVQTALDSSDGDVRCILAKAVQNELASSRSPYGRRILAKLKALQM